MAKDSMALLDLVEKYADGELFRELGQWVLQRLMELETEQQVGAGPHERNEDRKTHRNGYRDRRLETRVGTMNLKIPKLRSGSYFPSFLEPRKMSEHALVAVVQEAYVKGVSTRKVDALVQALGMSGISRSQVSRLCGELDEKYQDGAFSYESLRKSRLRTFAFTLEELRNIPYQGERSFGPDGKWDILSLNEQFP